jgi:hypothetical protein
MLHRKSRSLEHDMFRLSLSQFDPFLTHALSLDLYIRLKIKPNSARIKF